MLFCSSTGTVDVRNMKIYGKDTGIQTCYSLIDVRRTGSKLIVTNSEISNITLVNTNYPLIFSSGDKGVGDITVTNTVFTNIVHTDYNGSVFCFHSYEQAICLGNLTFISCSANRGGAIYSEYKDMQLSSCSFVNCTAAQSGGAIYWSPSTTPSSTKVVLSELTFCNNKASTNGHDVYINTMLTTSPFSGCTSYSTTKTSSFVYSGGNKDSWVTVYTSDCPCEYDSTSSLCNVIDDIDDVMIDDCPSDDGDPTPGKTLYVSTDGAETSNCGKSRESNPSSIHAVTVVFVTDVFGNCLSAQAPLS